MQNQELDFGITLDNGDNNGVSQSNRQFVKQSKKNKPRNSTKSQKYSGDDSKATILEQEQIVGVPPSGNYQLSNANHPSVCLATVFFKSLAFFIYFFCGYFLSSVITFIFTVVFSSLDFWVIKNVSGRLLVGLRWWSDYDQKGNQVWKFQTQNQNFKVNIVDKSFFWTSQIIGTLVWLLLLLINTLQLDVFWALLMGINFSLCALNLYGYYMCRGQHKSKVKKLKQNIGKAGLKHLAGAFI